MISPITAMFHYGTCSGWRWWPGAEVGSIFFLFVCGWPGDAAATFLPSRAFGLGKGLLVCMLLGMHLLVQEITGQIIPIINLQLSLNLNLEIVFHHVNQGIFAAGIQHPLSDATIVPGHRINEDCK